MTHLNTVMKHFYFISFRNVYSSDHAVHTTFLHQGERHIISNLLQNEPLSAFQTFLSFSYLFPRHKDQQARFFL